jgi:hypothetical protein
MDTWAIVQYDDRPLDDDTKKLVARNKRYCEKHGYTYIFEMKKYDLPPWWRKVKLVQEVMQTNKFKGVLWLDTDAVVYNHEKTLDEVVKPHKSFYYSADSPQWKSTFNAGVWLVLNDNNGNRIINSWKNLYSPTDWSEENGKWTSSGVWAGPTYEQGAFITHIQVPFAPYLHKYHWHFFQSYTVHPDTFTMHFAGELSDMYLKDFLDIPRPYAIWRWFLLILTFVCIVAFLLYSGSCSYRINGYANRIFSYTKRLYRA